MTGLSLWQQAAVIAICAGMTMATRFLPFLLFRPGRTVPGYVRYLGRALPAAVFALLVVYCLRHVPLFADGHPAPELLSAAVTAGLHLWRRNMMLSMAGGTACCMVLVQFVFR